MSDAINDKAGKIELYEHICPFGGTQAHLGTYVLSIQFNAELSKKGTFLFSFLIYLPYENSP